MVLEIYFKIKVLKSPMSRQLNLFLKRTLLTLKKGQMESQKTFSKIWLLITIQTHPKFSLLSLTKKNHIKKKLNR